MGRCRADVFEQALHRIADFENGGVERGLVCTGGLAKAADLSHELQSRGGDFLARRGLIRPPEYFDASAHT